MNSVSAATTAVLRVGSSTDRPCWASSLGSRVHHDWIWVFHRDTNRRNMIGMNGRDGTEAIEMFVVEGHQIRDTMPHDRGDESCIMGRLPSYVVVRHKTFVSTRIILPVPHRYYRGYRRLPA